MKGAWFFVLACLASAQSQDGAKIFRQSCAVGYCHGSGGTVGRAPALVDRQFDAAFVLKVTSDGIPNTGMPAWKDRLSPAELNAVVAYVVKISGGSGTAVAAASPVSAIPADARKGRDLFFDAIRGTRCSTCHAVEGKGIAIGPNLTAGAPPTMQAIRNGKPASVRQARVANDAFPALLVDQKEEWARVYDLTVPPPVLRTVAKAELSWLGGSSWKHADAISSYRDEDLRSVAEYLKWLSSR
jgi:mono/diheme cytochrome c family protein